MATGTYIFGFHSNGDMHSFLLHNFQSEHNPPQILFRRLKGQRKVGMCVMNVSSEVFSESSSRLKSAVTSFQPLPSGQTERRSKGNVTLKNKQELLLQETCERRELCSKLQGFLLHAETSEDATVQGCLGFTSLTARCHV